MKIVMMTTFENPWGLEMIRALLADGRDLAGVICSYDPVLHRKEQSIFQARTQGHYRCPLLTDVAADHILPYYFTISHNSVLAENILRTIKPDLLILGGADIIKPHILAIPTKGTVNIHPGLLPEYRGCSAVEWALYNDDPVGTTCHFVTPGIDGGPIIYQETLPIARGELYEAVRARMFEHGAAVLVKAIRLLERGATGVSCAPDRGRYYGVMGSEELAVVKNKLVTMSYRHYRE